MFREKGVEAEAAAFVAKVKDSQRFRWMGVIDRVDELDRPRLGIYVIERCPKKTYEVGDDVTDVDIVPEFRALSLA